MSRERIARTANGIPQLTRRQTQRVHLYAADLVRTGTSTRNVSPMLLASALCELAWHAADVRWQLEQFISGSAAAVPARQVALVALDILRTMNTMTMDEQVTYLQMLLGEDRDVVVTPGTATH